MALSAEEIACPQCGRPAIGYAFATTASYVRCALGHVWGASPDPAPCTGADPTSSVKETT